MLNFIIVNNDENFNKNIKNVITKAMFDENIDYNIKLFSSDSLQLQKTVNKNENKIYIIDVEVNNINGIDLAKEIRKNDWTSQIIFITNYQINITMIIQNRLMPLDLIYKFEENFEKRLTNDIKQIIKIYHKNEHLILKNQTSIITIPLKDILYITKDSLSRKCQITTTNKTYSINETLTDIKSKLNNNFIQSHRACIINIEKVESINKINNSIIFENNHTIDLISRNYKKDIINKLKSYD